MQIRLRVKAKRCDRPVLKQTFSDTSADVLADDEEMLRDYFGTDSVGLSATVKLLNA